jgi:hypothetical protein
MEYGMISADGATTNVIATATVETQGLCGPAQGNKTFMVIGDVLTVSEDGVADVVYNRLLGTTNPIVGSWLRGNIQDSGEAHTILTMLDDTTFTLSQDCRTGPAPGFEYGTYNWDQGTNDLTGALTIDTNGVCGIHDNAAMNISGFTVTVVGDTLTLTETASGGVSTFTRISPAYVIPMTQIVYTLVNVMMETGEQITGSFTWSYPEGGDFAAGTGQFTELNIPGYGTDVAALTISFNITEDIQISLAANTNNEGLNILFTLSQPLSSTQASPLDLTTSAYDIKVNGVRTGLFISGAIAP